MIQEEIQTEPEKTIESHKSKGRETVIQVSNLQKSFGSQPVLKNISFSLYKGENLVVLGKSGTGKSVLIKCIVRLLQEDKGNINILGKNVNELDRNGLAEIRQKVGFLFQGGALYDSMNVRQNLDFPLRRIKKKLTERQREEKINEVLEQVGLADSIDKMPSQLSGGMRKRISLARTLVIDPQVMLYDEPTTGLDPVTSAEISELILDLQKKYKTSSIIITHDIVCAQMTANRLIMLNEGEVYQEGTLEEFEQSKDKLLHSFFKQKN